MKTKESINEKLTQLEYQTGLKESVVIFHQITSDANGASGSYTYSEDENGNKTFYKEGIPLTKGQLTDITVKIVDDI